ncbi:MAG: TrkA family potassium uptake protein [Rikenellaceae bacterium]
MKYIVIGLGNYGQVLAKELTALHHEVIGVDRDPANVEMVKDSISTTFILDATNEASLSILPLRSVDVVVVAIGEAFGESVKVVAMLKNSGVKKIYARALNPVHKSVLEAFDIDMVLTPEQDAARALVLRLDMRISIESMQLDDEHYIMKFQLPTSLVGLKVKDLSLEKEFDLKIISLLNGQRRTNALGIWISDRTIVENLDMDYLLGEGDYLVCYGKYQNFRLFWRSM